MNYKNYDYKKAKTTIKDYLANPAFGELIEASLGMKEDLGWTTETIWYMGKFAIRLAKNTKIAGINKSYWATPILSLRILNPMQLEEFVVEVPCYFETEE